MAREERRQRDWGWCGRRCVVLLVFRPDEEEEELIARVIEWVRMVGAQCPGARMVLVCTHAKSTSAKPKSGAVQEVASRVKAAVSAEVDTLNQEIREEVQRLKQHQAARKEDRAVRDRLRSLVDKETGGAKQLGLLGDRAWCVDSVEGDVTELRAWLVEEVAKLPFMRELVPVRWLQVKEAVEQAQNKVVEQAEASTQSKAVLSKAQVLSILDLADEKWDGLSAEESWEAVEFFSAMGEWKVHRDTLVPDMRLLMDLTRALTFYCPITALDRMTRDAAEECDRQFVPGFRALPREEQEAVRQGAAALEQRAEVPEALLVQLDQWAGRGEEERSALMAVLEQMDLVAPLKSDQAGRRWLAVLRLESKTWRAGASIEFDGNIVKGSDTFICSWLSGRF
eukprot:419444-Rhodomonas_salina.1